MKDNAKRQKENFVTMFRDIYGMREGKLSKQDIEFIVENFNMQAHETKKEIVRYMITEKMTGKMEGFSALSTSAAINPNCAKLAKNPNCICSKCYAQKAIARYTNLAVKLALNAIILSNCQLAPEDIPRLNCEFFRFESHGDLLNITHLLNLFVICSVNSHVKFTLWTKHITIFYLLDSFDMIPENLQIGYSIPKLNPTETEINTAIKKHAIEHRIISFVFAVYDWEHAQNTTINCQKKCNACLKCYNRINTNRKGEKWSCVIIRENLK